MSVMDGHNLINYGPSCIFLFFGAIMATDSMVRSNALLFLAARPLVCGLYKGVVFAIPVGQRPKTNGRSVFVFGRCNGVIIFNGSGSTVTVVMTVPTAHYYVRARGSIMAVAAVMSVYRARKTVLSTSKEDST